MELLTKYVPMWHFQHDQPNKMITMDVWKR